MELLKQRIRSEGVNLGNGILKVDSFINHQVDPALMLAVGGALAARDRCNNHCFLVAAGFADCQSSMAQAAWIGDPQQFRSRHRCLHPGWHPDRRRRRLAGWAGAQ